MEKKLSINEDRIKACLLGMPTTETLKTTTKKPRCDIWKLLMSMFLDRCILDASGLSMGNLPNVEKSMSVQRIKKDIESNTKKLLNNQSRNASLLKQKTSVYGLYHHIIQGVTRRDRMIMYMVDFLFGISLLGFCFSVAYIFVPMLLFKKHPELWTSEIMILVFFTNSSLFFPVLVKRLDAKYVIKVRLSMQQMIYDKLLVSDNYFLDNSDNNYLYKLLYSELENYVRLSSTKRFMVPLMVVLLGTFGALWVNYNRTLMGLAINLIFTIVTSMINKVIVGKSQVVYDRIVFSHRKLLYELIVNFKSFTLKNLKPRFAESLDNITKIKIQKLKSIIELEKCNLVNGFRSFCFLLLLDPILSYFALKYGFRITYFTIELFLPMVMTNIIIYEVFYLYLAKSSLFCHAPCRQIYDLYFDNDYVIENKSQDSDVSPGQVIFQSCDILEREPDIVMIRLKKPYFTSGEFMSLGDVKKDYEESGKDQSYLSLMKLKFQNLVKYEDPDELNKLKLVCKNLSVDIKPGSRVCVFDNKNSRSIKGILNAIMQENYISSGSLSMRGTISYLSIKRPNFLVGKTIRDNIIFKQELDQLRYDNILKTLGINFSNYHGQDYYQLTEDASNIRADDKRNIMLARFLYYQSDIYIIEEYLVDLDFGVHGKLIRSLFDLTLKGRTIVYVANKIEAIQLSDTLICLSSDSDIHVVQTKKYLQFLDSSVMLNKRLWSYKEIPTIKGGGVQVLQHKMKNCIFVANISFEEEMVIYKKLQRQKQHIEKMKLQTNDVFEFIAYGLYLSHHRRTQGEFLDDDFSQLKFDELKLFMKKIFKKKGSSYCSLVFITLLLTLQVVCMMAGEYLSFYLCYEILRQRPLEFDSVKIISPVIVALVISSKLIEALRQRYVQEIFWNKVLIVGKEIKSSILDSHISQILDKRSHRVLDVVSKEFSMFEKTCLPIFKNIYEQVYTVIMAAGVLIVVTSLWVLPVFAIGGYVCYSFYRSVLPVYYSGTKLHSFIDYKIDDLHFQLLSIVGSMRRSGKQERLGENLQNLANNYVRSRHLTGVQLTTGIRLISTILCSLISFSIMCIIFMFVKYPSLNFFNMKWITLSWSFLYVFRLAVVQLSLPSSINNLMEMSKTVTKLLSFILKQQSTGSAAGGSLRKIDYSQPIIFKQVSVTIGIQPVFKKISFKIHIGSRVALLGIDGSGRSVLFELLTKVMQADPSEYTEISLFGWSLEEISEKIIKESIFVLERDPVLFEGTVRENLDPYSAYTDEEIKKNLKDLKIAKILIKAEMIESQAEIMNKDKMYIKNRVAVFDQIKESKTEDLKKTGNLVRLENNGQSFSRLDSLVLNSPLASSVKRGIFKNYKSAKSECRSKQQGKPSRFNINQNREGVQDSIDNRIIPLQKTGSHKTQRVEPTLEMPSQAQNSPIKFDTQVSVLTSTRRLPGNEKASETDRDTHKLPMLLELVKVNQEDSVKTLKKGISFKVVNVPSPRNKLGVTSIDDESSINYPNELSIEEISVNILESVFDKHKASEKKSQNEPDSPSKSYTSPKLKDLHKYLNKTIEAFSREPMSPNNRYPTKNSSNRLVGSLADNFSLSNHEDMKSLSDKHHTSFLDKTVSFGGKNLEKDVRKLINFARAIITKPRLLLVYEESLNFGDGIDHNLEILSGELKESTIICITKSNRNLLFYDKLLFFDAGKILEKGNPKILISQRNSFLHRYLSEVDPSSLEYLQEKKVEMELEAKREKLKKMQFPSSRNILNDKKIGSQIIEDSKKRGSFESQIIGGTLRDPKQVFSELSLVPLEQNANKIQPQKVLKDIEILMEPVDLDLHKNDRGESSLDSSIDEGYNINRAREFNNSQSNPEIPNEERLSLQSIDERHQQLPMPRQKKLIKDMPNGTFIRSIEKNPHTIINFGAETLRPLTRSAMIKIDNATMDERYLNTIPELSEGLEFASATALPKIKLDGFEWKASTGTLPSPEKKDKRSVNSESLDAGELSVFHKSIKSSKFFKKV